MIEKTIKENKYKKKNKTKSFSFNSYSFFLLVILIGLPLTLLAAFFLAFKGRVYPKVSVCQTDLSGKNISEATNLLNEELKSTTPNIIYLTYLDKTFTLPNINIEYQTALSSQNAYRASRSQSLKERLKETILILKEGKKLSYTFQINEPRLEAEIASIAAKLNVPAVEPDIIIVTSNNQKNIFVETGEKGIEVDTNLLKNNLLAQLSCPKSEISLEIPIVATQPKISTSMAEETRIRATKFLNKKITITFEEQKWEVGDEELISFLSFYGGFDQIKISQYGKNLAKIVNSPPENASFQFENNRVTLFKPSKDGISLLEDQFMGDFEKALENLEINSENQELALSVNKTPPKISLENVNSLGLKELIGKGTSLFYGSTTERIHNLSLASLKLNGILVAPDEVFSFNKALGDVSADTGFKQAYIIKDGRTVLGDGGGVCQVSTTLFRAALNAGLPILERHAHAYRVHYYEDDLGPGLDATVFDPSADLKIKNDTASYILIQSSVNLKKKQLTFEIYGTSDGRQSTISKVRVWDKVPPLPDLYQDDPTLPVGTIKQVDWKAWGAKAAFDYKVVRDGVTLTEKTFTSYYRPWQAVFLRGTKI